MRTNFKVVIFNFTNIRGWPTGNPERGIIHTDGNPRPHSAINALRWGNRNRAFSIHYYIEDDTVYKGIPETWHASHAKRAGVAIKEGYRTTWPGLSAPRGDIRAIGIEHVMDENGLWSQDTRITSVLLAAKIWKHWPNLRWSDHAHWDPQSRPFDVGDALYLPDWILDVKDVMAGREPFRVVNATASPGPFASIRPDLVGPVGRTEELVRLGARMSAHEENGAAHNHRHPLQISGPVAGTT